MTNEITIIETPPEKATETTNKIIQEPTTKNTCIVTLTRPATTLKKYIKNKNTYIIDCTGTKTTEENVTTIDHPTSLAEINITINEWLKKTTNKKLILDSITTLSMYNEPNQVARFTHTLITNLRLTNTEGTIITSKESLPKELRAEILQLADQTITYDDATKQNPNPPKE